MCTKGRDVIGVVWWTTPTRYSCFMPNNCNQQSIVRQRFKDLPVLSHKLYMHMRALLLADIVIVARVQPRTSKGITDLFLPITSNKFSLFVLYRRKPTLIMQAWTSFPGRLLVSQKVPHTILQKLVPPIIQQRSRSLTESTRQLKPPTKNGHAPPPNESWKSYQSVNPHAVWTW